MPEEVTGGDPVEALIPSAISGTLPPQNRSEHQGVCGVPSERSGCAAYPGFHPGLVCGAPLGHSERLTFPEASCASTKRQRVGDGASVGSEQQNPSRAARIVYPPPEFPCERRPRPAEPSEDVPLNDVPLNDVPLNDAPLNDVPLNDVPLSENPSTACGWIPSPQWSQAQAFCAIIPLWRA